MAVKQTTLNTLMELISAMRSKITGCDWHKTQTMHSIMPATLEEIYELLEAIDTQSADKIKDELADVMFHVLYYVQLAKELEWFNLSDLLSHLEEKIIRRHPQVFKQQVDNVTKNTEVMSWEELKQTEAHRAQTIAEVDLSKLIMLRPALLQAFTIQKEVKLTGFDWQEVSPIFDKIKEELSEVEEAIIQNSSEAISEELGDLLFACVNLSRQCNVNPEFALNQANRKFIKRFSAMQQALSKEQGQAKKLKLNEWDKLWDQVKSLEKS